MTETEEHHKRWLRIANAFDGLRVRIAEVGRHDEAALRHEHMNALQAQLAAFELSMRRVFKAKVGKGDRQPDVSTE